MSEAIYLNGAVVCFERMEECSRIADGERWCFYCHKRREFEFIVTAPIEPSYYEPNPRVECATCKTTDGDCFPGHSRTWGDE